MEGITISTNLPGDAGSRPPLGTLPVLVYDHAHGLDPNQRRQTAFAIGDQSLHTGVVPELADDNYYVTQHGWVLLVASASGPSSARLRRTRLWDPRTGESVPLPAMDGELLPRCGGNWKCSLSDAPTAAASSCLVLVLDLRKSSFLYCRVGDAAWKSHDYDLPGNVIRPPPDEAPPEPLVIHEVAAVGGKFYFQAAGGPVWKKLGAFDLSSLATPPELSFVEYPEPEHPEFPGGCSWCIRHLVASSGGDELLDVHIWHKGFTPEVLTVRVYKIELTGAATPPPPREVKDLGDRACLLSHSGSQLLAPASKYGVKGNRVYFNHNLLEERDGERLYIYDYDLEEQSLEAVRPCQGMPEMPQLLRDPFWVLPTTHQD